MRPGEYDIMFRVEQRHWWYRALRRVLRMNMDRHLPDWREKRILDAGCGTGANLEMMKESRMSVGLDLSPEALEFCRSRGFTDLVRGDVTSLGLASEHFGAVVSTSVLYHRWVADVDQALREFHRVLQPGGMLFLDLPAYDWLHSEHDEAVYTARRFTRKQISLQLQAAGFRVIRITYWNTLLFPLILLVRRLGILETGRDFEMESASSHKPGMVQRALNLVMVMESQIMRVVPLPFGVSISCVAQKVSS